MCMFDDGEQVEVLSTAKPVARKEHKCMECRRVIRPGEKYMVERYVFEGSLSYHKTCSHCQIVREWLLAECSGFVYTMIREDIEEHVMNGDYGVGVKLLAIGIGRKWRRKDGRQWPRPRLPKTTHQLMAEKSPQPYSGTVAFGA